MFTERLIILDTDPVARLEVRQTYNTSNSIIIIILDTDPVARLEVRQTYNTSNIIIIIIITIMLSA